MVYRSRPGLLSIGYCLIAIALLTGFSTTAKTFLAGLGSLLAGYAAVSLMDNIVCMACSISFPQNRAAVVGYLKAVLATAGGLWALLWVQVGCDGVFFHHDRTCGPLSNSRL